MSDEFDGLDATDKAGIEAALNRCRDVAARIASELRNKRPEHFVDKLSLADLCASLEHAADVLGQKVLMLLQLEGLARLEVAQPQRNSSLDYRRSDARIAEKGFAAGSGVSKSAKVVLGPAVLVPLLPGA
jgi:hypothetical protein